MLAAQQPQAGATLKGKLYDVAQLPLHSSANGASKSRSIFNGMTTRGQHLTMHMTELAPGQEPHPAGRQPHDEVIIILQGTLAVTLNGQTSTLGPGSVIYSAYNDLKGWRNVGTGPAQYYVLALEEHVS